jgi:hypothetical protein
MRVAEDDDLHDGDDQDDDESCTRQRPRRRHCWVWTKTGAYTVQACAHCPKVKASWLSDDGDPERIRQSVASHHERCVRLVPWLVPAQRRHAAGAPPAVSRPAAGATSRRGH